MKTLKKLAMTTLLISFLATASFAQSGNAVKKTGTSPKLKTQQSMTPGKFVDKNNNGVCDNYETRVWAGQGANFVDKNGDGICDRRQSGSNSACYGIGNQHRHGNGNGNGKGNGCCRGMQPKK